ncbi:MAG: tetratricopeptide repeat protein [Sphingomonas sp.]|uniref:tetratricopeptide repeat protein n=1 Tax=Sphingomonas sp. TaxID=28214 RepID=UPI001B07BBF8|nr:tetratricopeptide repeat protein [Sphingomonas sp.]MBO9623542.1 tetratricopeptide repeat protein [Sphingomonas sp.]
MRIALLLLAAAPLAAALPAQAQESTAAREIVGGAYDKAELKLASELRARPDQPELLLNLAAVYSQTGRSAEARAVYNKVLAQDEVLLDLASRRTTSSHAIARAGLQRLQTVQFSAR